LTETDLSYLNAMRSLGLDKVMLSFVERPTDVMELKSILPDAEILLKIESLKGVSFARKYKNSLGRLMAARGDLYVEVVRPHRIVGALRDIIHADPHAIAASRIFDSLAASPIPYAADIGDVAFLLSIGYRSFMLGDTTCMHRDTVLEALNLLDSVARQFI
jgi:pyruvate kinase